MQGKTIVITGGNSGIGRATSVELAKQGAQLVLACRDPQAAEPVAQEIRKESGNENVVVRELDLASLASVRRFAASFLEEFDRLDVLINNAGVFPSELRKTEEGFEEQFGVNHLGHFLLTNLLRERLEASAPSRVVNVSSMMHARAEVDFDNLRGEKGYSAMAAYGQSKLCNILFSNELARRLAGTGVTSNALHPGSISTNITRNSPAVMRFFTKLFFSSPEKGAKTSVYLATDPALEPVSGKYFDASKEKEPSAVALDEAVQSRLWDESAAFCGIAVS
jgi:NAD(P)-dependent dehydrogenase (short-subunit alcohol dehydrogenase family)